MPAAATSRRAVLGLACDDGRHTLVSVCAWIEKGRLPTAATPCRGPFLSSPALVGGAHQQMSMPEQREMGDAGHRHTAWSHSDSFAMMGGGHRQASAPGQRKGGCQPPPHLAEPIPDSPVLVGGAHRPASTLGRREVGDASRHHTAWSRSRTLPRRWEVRTGKRPRPDEEREGVGHRHTLRNRSQTRPRRLEARKCPLMERERWQPPSHHAEPYSDSPATVGGAHRQASAPAGWG
jgi:hypothetical protein